MPSDAHAAPAEAKPFAGQLVPLPVQFSVTSHASTAARHGVLAERKPSVGQVALLPVQLSGASQTPTAARHEVPADFTRLTQVPAPSHVSCASHPAVLEEPHVVAEDFGEAALSAQTDEPVPH